MRIVNKNFVEKHLRLRRPFVEQSPVRLDEMVLGEFALLYGKPRSFLAVIDDLRERVVLMLQTWLEAFASDGVSVINLWTVNPLERLHGADRTDELDRKSTRLNSSH